MLADNAHNFYPFLFLGGAVRKRSGDQRAPRELGGQVPREYEILEIPTGKGDHTTLYYSTGR